MFGTLELNRTNPAHIGTAPVKNLSSNIAGLSGTESSGSTEKTKGKFETYLLEAMNTMNSQQVEVSNIQEKLITDPDSVDIHDVTTAMAKAQMSLSLAQTVIDRLVSGWNELSTNR